MQCRSQAVFYSHEVQTIFQAAGLQLTVKETERAGHATEMVQELAISSCDALLTVGGDGTVFEALQVIAAATCFCVKPELEAWLHGMSSSCCQTYSMTSIPLQRMGCVWELQSSDPYPSLENTCVVPTSARSSVFCISPRTHHDSKTSMTCSVLGFPFCLLL